MMSDLAHAATVGGQGGQETDPSGGDQNAEIADALINLVRTYGYLKAKLASSVDPEISSLFLLVRLVKDGPKRAKELADSMCADQSTVSRQVAALVKAGLLERKADPDDGRASILVPTETGINQVLDHVVNRGRAIEPIISDWSESDRRQFLRLLRRYNTTLDARRDEVVSSMARGHSLHGNTADFAERNAPPHDHSQPNDRTERSN